MLKYMPKRLSFSYKGMKARSMLAVMDNNFNIGRNQATTAKGAKRWVVHWSKVTKKFVAKKIYEPKQYSFRADLMQATLQRLQSSKRLLMIVFH